MLQVKNIKRIQIVTLYKDLLYGENAMSLGTVKYVNNLIASSFKQAVYNDIINKDPSMGALKEIANEAQHKVDALTVAEQNLFFKIIRKNKLYLRYRPMFTTAFGSGVRVGELAALTWSDIDFENETISVNKTLHFVKYLTEAGHHYSITTPKTLSSVRIIPMLGAVKKALYDQKQYQETFNIKGNLDIDGYCDFVFTTMRRTPYTPDGVNTLLSRIVASYNKEEKHKALEEKRDTILLRNFSPHVTRHSFSTRCYECGMDAKAVQEILGHSNIKTTLDIYTDCSIEVKRKQLHLMEGTVIT